MLLTTQEILNGQLESNSGTLRVSAIAGYTYQNITTSAQTTVKSTAGLLHGITINSVPTSGLRVYDNAVSGGTTVATIPASVAAGTFYQYDVKLVSGLTVSSGSSDTNITVTYL